MAVPAAPAQLRRTRSSSRLVVGRAAELEEIDPMTGEVISGTSMAAEANERVQVGGNEWAFRSATVNSKLATPDKLPVVCLHGIGSSSYTYRNLLQLLGDAGHEAVAVDWLGHGASSKASEHDCCCCQETLAAPALLPAPVPLSLTSSVATLIHHLCHLQPFLCSPQAALTTQLTPLWRLCSSLWRQQASGSHLLWLCRVRMGG